MASHIQQEGVLVFLAASSPPRHISQEGVLVFASADAPRHISQEGVLVFRENVADDAQPPRTSRATFVG